MASSDEKPRLMPGADDGTTPGKELTMGHQIMDKGSKLMQSLKPINKISEHVSTFSVYSQNMSRQIETHHFISRLNQDFCQCAVYDSHLPNARLIGIEYIISEKIFESLPPEEQKLWHSHAYEIKAGLWVNPGVPGMIQNPELQTFAKTYGKFWCTWQVDRGNIFLSAGLLTVFLRDVSQAQSIKGDKLPLGAPTLMMSPQSENRICTELIKKREEKYQVLNESLISSRSNIEEPQPLISYADHWRQSGKGFAIDIQKVFIL